MNRDAYTKHCRLQPICNSFERQLRTRGSRLKVGGQSRPFDAVRSNIKGHVFDTQ
jgi:hypothetical protein